MAEAVDQHRLGVFEVPHDLVGDDPRFVPVLFGEPELVQDRLSGLPYIGLALRMNLQHPVVPLDDLHAGGHVGRLEGHVEHVVDRHAGRNLDEQARLPHLGQVAL